MNQILVTLSPDLVVMLEVVTFLSDLVFMLAVAVALATLDE
jgi:hypothetical protein